MVWRTKGTLVIDAIDGDMVKCDECTLAPKCSYFGQGQDCTMPEGKHSVWVKKLASGQVADLEDGLAHILALQAERVLAMVDDEEIAVAEMSASQKMKYYERVDKNVDKLYKNALALRNARSPRANARNPQVIDQNGNDDGPTPQLIARGINELVQGGIPRENITRMDVISHLRDTGQLALPSGAEGDF